MPLLTQPDRLSSTRKNGFRSIELVLLWLPPGHRDVFLSLQRPSKENSYLNPTMSLKRKEKVATDNNTNLIFSIHHVRHKGVDYKRGASANTPRNGFFPHRMWRTTSCVNERFGFVMRNEKRGTVCQRVRKERTNVDGTVTCCWVGGF